MICRVCRDAGNLIATDITDKKYKAEVWHSNCKGASWCDCQHKLESVVRKK